jgi:hypothetical protein
MGAERYWRTLKCLFDGTKSEQRFKFRHTPDVSFRALGGVLRPSLPFQRLELLSHRVGSKIEMRAVPGRNAGA